MKRTETRMFLSKLVSSVRWKNAVTVIFCIVVLLIPHIADCDELSKDELDSVKALESHRIEAINKVVGSVIAIYDEDRQGGGSGVIIDPSGIALTNHHVIMGAGVSGWGGLADGNLYPWKLIGTDPGGDVAIIQMEGQTRFPFTPLGDSDQVRVGDWALAMGNPFILTEDQSPTVTLGIVSGVKRYQSGAGMNQLVYGNCIQVDSSINPGNSGGPLFDLNGRVIGINGRGSFQDRGRVNVGLGYAISSNQIKNFIPDLLATKLVEHGTLDASFSDRDGKVVCSTINRDAPVAAAGLNLGDELLQFEGSQIYNANQYTNLICTLPEDWPASLKIRKPNGDVALIHVRMFGLPYQQPKKPKRKKKGDKEPTPEEKQKVQRQQEMIQLLSAPPGTVRFVEINREYTNQIIEQWQERDGKKPQDQTAVIKLVDSLEREEEVVGKQELWLATDGKFRIRWQMEDESKTILFDGRKYFMKMTGEPAEEISLVQAKLQLPVVQAISLTAMLQKNAFAAQGKTMIDGGDKALQEIAYRLRVTDVEDDPFFVWLRMYDNETGLPAARLLKASPEKDCNEKGGVTFTQWKEAEGTFIPRRREFVRGLEESVFLRLINESCQWLEDTDRNLFDATGLKNMETADTKTTEPGEDQP